MGTLQQLKADFEAIHKRMKDEGKAALGAAFSEFFAAHPIATAIMWEQYTPYFNDGDECVFSVSEYELRVDADRLSDADRAAYLGTRDDDDDDEGYQYGDLCAASVFYPETSPHHAVYVAFDELTGALTDDLLRAVFGDHVSVRATPSGFEVTDCEHE